MAFDVKQGFWDCLDLPNPELHICGKINSEMYDWVSKALLFLKAKKSPDITIVIDSGGGDVGPGLDIYDLLRLYKGKKTALVVNSAASMAAVIMQACEIRTCARHAGILIHYVSRSDVSLGEISTRKGWQKVVKKLRDTQTRLYHILEERTKRSRSEIVRECRKDRFMKSDEALEFRLIDKIV